MPTVDERHLVGRVRTHNVSPQIRSGVTSFV
jgi:hypothetical protein